MSTIKLTSSDKRTFEVDVELLHCSELLKDFAMTSGPDDVIPLPKVSGAILEKILEWAAHHKGEYIGKNEAADDIDSLTQWEKKFFQLDDQTILELNLAANYLAIKGLLNDLCRRIAAKVSDNNV